MIEESVAENNTYRQKAKHCDYPDCVNEGDDSKQLHACSSCRSVYYCSREHQEAHWKEHKKLCKAIRKWTFRRYHHFLLIMYMYIYTKNVMMVDQCHIIDFHTWRMTFKSYLIDIDICILYCRPVSVLHYYGGRHGSCFQTN